MAVIRTAIPNKGRLADDAARLLRTIGLRVPSANDRKLLVDSGKGRYQVLFASPWDIPRYLMTGAADVGITGLDILEETGNGVKRLLPLNFGFCRLSLAAPEAAPVQSARDVPASATVATSFPNLVRSFFRRIGTEVKIVEVRGATEVTPIIGAADFIVDLVETGSTLRMNHLKILDVILESRAFLIAGPQSLTTKAAEIRELVSAIESVVEAESRRYLMANVPVAKLAEIRAFLPGISGPTIMNLMGRDDMVAMHVVVKEDEVNGVIALLKDAGATGTLVVPIERMVV
ncbi:MAG: ATP phosphoribosyltransferase [Candidatus Thermoplasmatota archaeon]